MKNSHSDLAIERQQAATTILPCEHQIDEPVTIELAGQKIPGCLISCVRFYKDTVRYDVFIPKGDDWEYVESVHSGSIIENP